MLSSDQIFYLVNTLIYISILFPEFIDTFMIDMNVIIFILMDESKNLPNFAL